MAEEKKTTLEKAAGWSEEDEKIRHCIGLILTDAPEKRFKDYSLNLKECIDWLLSLHPSWKPSEEQMEALQCAIVFMEIRKASDYDITPLKSLYEQLKKL